LGAERVFRPRRDVRYRTVGGEGIVLRQEAREVLVLNETGARVLSLLDGRRDVAGVEAALEAERDAPAQEIRRDLEEFLEELLAAGVVEEIEG
jgi:hypothetical protein